MNCKKVKWKIKFRLFTIRRRTATKKERKNKLICNTGKLKYFSDGTPGISNPNDKDFILG